MKRAEAHLLEQLYAHMSDLQSFEAESLLDEDPDLLQRRAATKQAFLFLKLCFLQCTGSLLTRRVLGASKSGPPSLEHATAERVRSGIG